MSSFRNARSPVRRKRRNRSSSSSSEGSAILRSGPEPEGGVGFVEADPVGLARDGKDLSRQLLTLLVDGGVGLEGRTARDLHGRVDNFELPQKRRSVTGLEKVAAKLVDRDTEIFNGVEIEAQQ